MLLSATTQTPIWDYFSQTFGFLVSWFAIVFFAFGEPLPTSLGALFSETSRKRVRMNIGALGFAALFVVANNLVPAS